MNDECKSCMLIFPLLALYSYSLKAPNIITYGSFACSITGILCHYFGYRKIDIITTRIIIIMNIYYAYVNGYLTLGSIMFSLVGAVMYINKTKQHVIFVQVPYFIGIVLMINEYKNK